MMKRWLPQKLVSRLRLGLLPRLLFALALVGAVPLVVITADRGQVEDTLREQVLRTHALAAHNLAGRVTAFLDINRALTRSLANNPQVYLAPSSEIAGELLAGLLQARSDITVVALTNLEGEEYLRAQRRDLDASTARVFEAISDREVSVYETSSGTWIRLDEPFADGSGVVRMIASAAPLAAMLEPKEIGRQAELVIADREGAVVAGSVSTLELFPASLVANALSGRLSGAAGEDPEVVGAFSPVVSVPWVVLSTQPREVAEAVARRLRARTRIALAGALLAVGLLALAAWASVVRPIRELIQAQRSLAGLAAAPAQGSEIKQLKESFAILERRVRDREALDKVFLGRYQVLEVLGEGGMGTVFRGWDPTLKRPVALKTLRLSLELEAEKRRQRITELLTEAITTARITHPNVVSVYDVMEQEEHAFIAMEMVDGISLEDYLAHKRRLIPERVVSLGRQIALGLGAAHERGIVHHDVKPANVLLGWQGEVKVVDFGIARFLSSLADERDKIYGTPGYLPPESLRGEGYNEAGDLFGLGAILYACLTGRRPFLGSTVRDTVVRTLKDEPLAPSALAPGIPPALEGIVSRLLAKTREERFSSAREVIVLFEELDEDPWSLSDFSEGHEQAFRERKTFYDSEMDRSSLLRTVGGSPR